MLSGPQNIEANSDVYYAIKANPSHTKNKSSLMNFVDPYQCYDHQRHQLENSAVTFQYYNSSKFASNQTNKELSKGQQNVQNCFYMTKTTNQESLQSKSVANSNYNSKESHNQPMTACPPQPEKQFRHARVQDIVMNEEELKDDENLGFYYDAMSKSPYQHNNDHVIEELPENDEASQT